MSLIEQENFHVMHLTQSVEPVPTLKWITEISRTIKELGGISLVPSAIGRTEPQLRRAGARVINEPLGTEQRRGARKRLAALATKHKVEAYFVYDVLSSELAIELAKTTPAPIFFIVQEIFSKPSTFSFQKSRLQPQKISHFFLPSKFAAESLMRDYSISPAHITVIYEGIDLAATTDEFISPERTMSLAQNWGVVEDAVDIVLIPAEFDNARWLQNLSLFADVTSKYGSNCVKAIIIGDDDGSGIMKRVEDQLAAKHAPVYLVGHCADIDAAIKLSSAVVILEGAPKTSYPLALMAQAIGRTIVLPDTELSSEIIDIGGSGLAAQQTHEGFTHVLNTILDIDDMQRQSIITAGRLHIQKNFSQAAMHQKLVEFFETAT